MMIVIAYKIKSHIVDHVFQFYPLTMPTSLVAHLGAVVRHPPTGTLDEPEAGSSSASTSEYGKRVKFYHI
jgi:hypothetical protein